MLRAARESSVWQRIVPTFLRPPSRCQCPPLHETPPLIDTFADVDMLARDACMADRSATEIFTKDSSISFLADHVAPIVA
jgi:hypothetical protein